MHGIVEVHAQDVDKEVDGVAVEVSVRPAPVTFFDDQAGIGGQDKVARLFGDVQLCRLVSVEFPFPVNRWIRENLHRADGTPECLVTVYAAIAFLTNSFSSSVHWLMAWRMRLTRTVSSG